MVLSLTERHGQHQSSVRAMMWKLYIWKEEDDSNPFHGFIRMRAARLCYQAQATIAPEPTSEVEAGETRCNCRIVSNTWGGNFD
jgi:hypothetical protein